MKYILTALTCFAFLFQPRRSNAQFEIRPILRFDSYPKFHYAINPSNSFEVKLSGTSWGILAGYKFPLKKNFLISAGLRYSKYSFDKIKQVNNVFGESDTRVVENYVPPGSGIPSIIFTTKKYWYNSIVIHASAERKFFIDKKVEVLAGAGISNYLAISERYEVNYPTGHTYKRLSHRKFWILLNLRNSNFQKKVLRLQEYAEALHLHPNYLNTVIKSKTGKPVGA